MMKWLVLTMKIFMAEKADDEREKGMLLSEIRMLTPDIEILHNEQSLFQLLLPAGQTSLTDLQLTWLAQSELIAEYECELLDEQSLQALRTQVLTARIEGHEASAISLEEVKAMATQISEANGVELWTKNVDANVHYIVARGLIFIRYNFGGRKLFNWLAHGRWVYDLTKEPWGF